VSGSGRVSDLRAAYRVGGSRERERRATREIPYVVQAGRWVTF
jgi:hypothetical protein